MFPFGEDKDESGCRCDAGRGEGEGGQKDAAVREEGNLEELFLRNGIVAEIYGPFLVQSVFYRTSSQRLITLSI